METDDPQPFKGKIYKKRKILITVSGNWTGASCSNNSKVWSILDRNRLQLHREDEPARKVKRGVAYRLRPALEIKLHVNMNASWFSYVN